MNKIKIITDETFLPDFEKSIHYISWTPYSTLSITNYSQMAYVDAIIRSNVPDIFPEELYRRIDCSNETGTLYPKINITIMPSYRQPYSDNEIYCHFDDAMNAQSLFIKANNIIIDMRNYTYINYHTDEPDNEEYLKMIYHNHILNSIAGPELNTYVVMLQQKNKEINHLYCEYATDAEIDYLKLIP